MIGYETNIIDSLSVWHSPSVLEAGKYSGNVQPQRQHYGDEGYKGGGDAATVLLRVGGDGKVAEQGRRIELRCYLIIVFYKRCC